MNVKTAWYVSLFFFVIFCDQFSKYVVLDLKNIPYSFNDFFGIDLIFNRGIMSGLLHSDSFFPFLLVNSIIILFLMFFIMFTYDRYKNNFPILGEILVIAGALSNIIDRFLYGGVIDFIKVSFYHFVWPIFNIADICIVLGVCIMILWSQDQKVYAC